MMKYCIFICIIIITGCSHHQEQSVTIENLHKLLKPIGSDVYAGFNQKQNVFYIGNRYVQRNMSLDQENCVFATTALIDKKTNTNWIAPLSDEFRFRIGKHSFTGRNGKLKYKDYDIHSYPNEVKELIVFFTVLDLSRGRGRSKLAFDLAVHYEVDSSTPVVRKRLEFDNLTDRTFAVEELVVESIRLLPDPLLFCGFRLNKLSSPEDSEPLVIAYAGLINCGLVLSSNIPGALKNYQFKDNEITLGMPSNNSPWRSEINLHAGERKASYRTFIMPFNDGIEGTWQYTWLKFVSRYFRISFLLREPVSTVNFTSVNEKVPFESNVELICVDWNLGNTELDQLVEMAQRVHENQQKFGVRIDLTTVNAEQNITDDWQFKKHNGKNWVDDKEKRHFCLASDYAFYVTNYLIYLVDEVNLDYLVFDGKVFGPDEENIGCASYRHKHFVPMDSVMLIYQNIFNIADLLHQNYQELVIAVSPESYAVDLPDYGLISHIDQFVFEPEESVFNTDKITKIFPQECILIKQD